MCFKQSKSEILTSHVTEVSARVSFLSSLSPANVLGSSSGVSSLLSLSSSDKTLAAARLLLESISSTNWQSTLVSPHLEGIIGTFIVVESHKLVLAFGVDIEGLGGNKAEHGCGKKLEHFLVMIIRGELWQV